MDIPAPQPDSTLDPQNRQTTTNLTPKTHEQNAAQAYSSALAVGQRASTCPRISLLPEPAARDDLNIDIQHRSCTYCDTSHPENFTSQLVHWNPRRPGWHLGPGKPTERHSHTDDLGQRKSNTATVKWHIQRLAVHGLSVYAPESIFNNPSALPLPHLKIIQ